MKYFITLIVLLHTSCSHQTREFDPEIDAALPADYGSRSTDKELERTTTPYIPPSQDLTILPEDKDPKPKEESKKEEPFEPVFKPQPEYNTPDPVEPPEKLDPSIESIIAHNPPPPRKISKPKKLKPNPVKLKVYDEWCWVRKGPQLYSPIVNRVQKDELLEVIDFNRSWYKVQYGYINKVCFK